MSIRSSLLLMAASLLPATLAAAPLPPTAELVKQLAVQEKAPNASPDQLAALYPALAPMPKGVSEYVTLNNVAGLAGSLSALGAQGGEVAPAAWDSLGSVAIGSSAGSAALCSAFLSLLEAAQPGAAALSEASGAGAPAADEELEAALAELAGKPLSPIYVVLTAAEGQGDALAGLAQALVQGLPFKPAAALPAGFTGGGRLDAETLLAGSSLAAAARESLAARPLHLFVKQEGELLVLVLCEKAGDAALPASPAASVLATPAGRAVALQGKGRKPLAALHLSPAFVEAWQKGQWSSLLEACEALSAAPQLAEAAATLTRYAKACAALPVKQPTTLRVWEEGKDIGLSFRMDAQGACYKPGTFCQLALADAASTIFYAEIRPKAAHPSMPERAELFRAGLSLLSTLLAPAPIQGGLPGEGGESVEEEAFESDGEEVPAASSMAGAGMMAAALLPSLGNGLGKVLAAMEGNAALVLDARGTMPEALGGKGKAAFPRLAIYAGVEKRSLLAEGWEALETALGGLGMGELPIASKKAGKAVRYSVENPMFTKDFMPNIILLGRHAVFGSSPALGVQMLKGAEKGRALPVGAVFQFRTKALATCLASMARAQSSDSLFEEEKPSPYRGAAQGARALSKKVEQVYGAAGIEAGAYWLKAVMVGR